MHSFVLFHFDYYFCWLSRDSVHGNNRYDNFKYVHVKLANVWNISLRAICNRLEKENEYNNALQYIVGKLLEGWDNGMQFYSILTIFLSATFS